jgi:GTP-binding protein
MQIQSAQFFKGVVKNNTDWDVTIPQVVLYGRSNAGKSSAVNIITGKKTLARASDTPGRTKEANFFTINNAWYLVDMPGYGYAKASKTDRASIEELIQWFIQEAPATTRKSVLIIDSKIGLTDLDRNVLNQLIQKNESIIILVNKTDRLTQSEVAKTLNNVRTEVPKDISVIPFSAKTGKGSDKLWTAIESQ